MSSWPMVYNDSTKTMAQGRDEGGNGGQMKRPEETLKGQRWTSNLAMKAGNTFLLDSQVKEPKALIPWRILKGIKRFIIDFNLYKHTHTHTLIYI